VDALATGKHFLTTDEEVEGIADLLEGESAIILDKGRNNTPDVPHQA